MLKIHQMMQLTIDEIPWALARFNDGEMLAVERDAKRVARGDQLVDESLATALMEALSYSAPNYFRGLPCTLCYPAHRLNALMYAREDQFTTMAVVQTNRNLKLWMAMFNVATVDRRIVWVGGEDQQPERTNLSDRIRRFIKVPMRDSWQKTEGGEVVIDDVYAVASKTDVIMLSCGPMATVLACKLFQRGFTAIDIGSTYEPRTRGIKHRCHDGTLPPCEECN